MLLPAFGDGRLPRKQGTQILEADHVREDREQREPNAERRSTRPPTQKRNCSPSAQRHHTAMSCHRPPPGGDNATCFFMNRLTLRRC
jgi:hypothetical protein